MKQYTKAMTILQLIKNTIFNYECFTYVYIFASVMWFFPFLGPFADPFIKVLFIWGSVLLIYDFFVKKTMFRGQYFIPLFVFLISYVITILVNIHGQFYMGVKHLIYSSIAVLLIFNLMKGKNERTIKNFIFKFNQILIYIAMIASVISIMMYIFSISIEMEYMGNNIRQGFIDHRLFGIYTSANTGATMSIFAVVFMLINSYIKCKQMWKWNNWYKVNFIIQLIYFSLTLSRGGQVTVYALVIVSLVAVLLPKYLKTTPMPKSIAKIVVVFLSFGVVSIFVPKGIQKGSMLINNVMGDLVSYSQDENEGDKEDETDEDDNEIKRIESGDDMSNNRFTIWGAGIQMWKKSPLFGVADVRIDEEQLKCGIYDISNLSEEQILWLGRIEGNLHNSYIEILVNCGVVGSIIFVIIAVLIGIKYLKFLLDRSMQMKSTYYLVGMIFAFIVSILVNCCFENRILFDRQNPFGLIFWLYLGIGSSLIDLNTKKAEEIQND